MGLSLSERNEFEVTFLVAIINSPPSFIYHNSIKELLGDLQLNLLKSWNPEISVVEIINELKLKIQNASKAPSPVVEDATVESIINSLDDTIHEEKQEVVPPSDEFITPDLNAYPPDFDIEDVQSQLTSDTELSPVDKPETPIISTPDFQDGGADFRHLLWHADPSKSSQGRG